MDTQDLRIYNIIRKFNFDGSLNYDKILLKYCLSIQKETEQILNIDINIEECNKNYADFHWLLLDSFKDFDIGRLCVLCVYLAWLRGNCRPFMHYRYCLGKFILLTDTWIKEQGGWQGVFKDINTEI